MLAQGIVEYSALTALADAVHRASIVARTGSGALTIECSGYASEMARR